MADYELQQEEMECQYCEETFKFTWADVHDSCDIRDGQYVRFDAVNCPHCRCENRW